MEVLNETGTVSSYLENINTAPAQFRVASSTSADCSLDAYNRRNFYKITLTLTGSSRLLFANRGIEINRPALVFTNPMIPYSWEGAHEDVTGYFCIFTNEFLYGKSRIENLGDLALFKTGTDPVYFLNDEQTSYIHGIFKRMLIEASSSYIFKNELIRSHLSVIIHEALKMHPSVTYFTPHKGVTRITNLFLELLERQFPVDSKQNTLQLKKAGDYAERLTIHVNHLNAAIREVTGKPTTAHINERILTEAKSLLKYTDLSVAEIAYSLGFEYASYFNNFFKKHAGQTPLTLRKNL